MLFKLIEVSFVSTGRDSDKPENDGGKHLAPFRLLPMNIA